jgi:hypothetical protein
LAQKKLFPKAVAFYFLKPKIKTIMASSARCILTLQQVLYIFRLKKSKTAEFLSPNGVVSAKMVGQFFKVSSKTVRDVWMGRTWYRATHHLEPTRSDAGERLEKRLGRPKGAKDRKPRVRKVLTLSIEPFVGSHLPPKIRSHSDDEDCAFDLPIPIIFEASWSCAATKIVKPDLDSSMPGQVDLAACHPIAASDQPFTTSSPHSQPLLSTSPISIDINQAAMNLPITTSSPQQQPLLSTSPISTMKSPDHTLLSQPAFNHFHWNPPAPPPPPPLISAATTAAVAVDFGDPFHDDWKYWA